MKIKYSWLCPITYDLTQFFSIRHKLYRLSSQSVCSVLRFQCKCPGGTTASVAKESWRTRRYKLPLMRCIRPNDTYLNPLIFRVARPILTPRCSRKEVKGKKQSHAGTRNSETRAFFFVAAFSDHLRTKNLEMLFVETHTLFLFFSLPSSPLSFVAGERRKSGPSTGSTVIQQRVTFFGRGRSIPAWMMPWLVRVRSAKCEN